MLVGERCSILAREPADGTTRNESESPGGLPKTLFGIRPKGPEFSFETITSRGTIHGKENEAFGRALQKAAASNGLIVRMRGEDQNSAKMVTEIHTAFPAGVRPLRLARAAYSAARTLAARSSSSL